MFREKRETSEGEDKWEREREKLNLKEDFWFVRDWSSRQIEGTIPKEFM